ncbi:hypothetical protein CASFOL_006996 [Castilleja foliolosa]|uniref:SS18 N-terminal domain-containing protein n=1 Tax=Castilleja foliolosa TaxID=1961234 RepID=A0ABD3E7Y8_9LAMI
MNKLQQQTMNSAPSMPLNLVSTEQIQKYLDENKNLIMAILETQNLGKVSECAQYQAILQKNLMYLAAIADAQPPGSSASSQPPTSSVAPQGESHVPQSQAAASQMQQQVGGGGPVAKLPFQMNALRPQDQQHQLMQFQQQQQQQMQQGQFSLGGGGANNGLHFLMQPQPGLGGVGGGGGMMDFRGGQPGGVQSSSGDGHGNLALVPGEGRD